jgi:hypothetical protein
MVVWAGVGWLLAVPHAAAEVAYSLDTAPQGLGTTFTHANVFGSSVFLTDDAADNPELEGDAVGLTVITMSGNGNSTGAGVSISISNGENGIDESAGGENIDPPNMTPVNAAIAAVNGGGRLQNGNALRFSLWMRQDPLNPVTVEPSVEPVVKFELWKQALSGSQPGDVDYDPGKSAPSYGDRIWDQDQNASNAAYTGLNQSQATWVDMGNDGTTTNPPGAVIGPSLVSDEWRRVVATIVIDDDPLDAGLPEGGWAIGGDIFGVSAVEEIRAVMFLGDYAGTVGLNGSIWIDNLLMEVFADEATMIATAIPNPIPVEGLPGDYNENNVVDAADYTVWRDNLNSPNALPNDDTPGVGQDDYDRWKQNFGMALGAAAGGIQSTAVPEPTTAWLVLAACGLASAGRLGRRGQ